MRLSSLLFTSVSFCLASVAVAQSGHMSDELRQEIRNLIREEIRAAMQQVHVQADKTAAAKNEGEKPATSFRLFSPEGSTKTTAKAFHMADGKLEAVKMGTHPFVFTTGEGQHKFEVIKTGDAKHEVRVVQPNSGMRVMTLAPTKDGAGEHKIEFVVAEEAEKKALAECCKALEAANECCTAVKAAANGAGECCEAGKGDKGVVEVEATPVKVKVKKGSKKKSKKAEKVGEITELKTRDVLEMLAR